MDRSDITRALEIDKELGIVEMTLDTLWLEGSTEEGCELDLKINGRRIGLSRLLWGPVTETVERELEDRKAALLAELEEL